MSEFIKKFLGSERWHALAVALKETISADRPPAVSTAWVFFALTVAAIPILSTFVDELRPAGSPPTIYPTVAFGVCAVVAFLAREHLALGPASRLNWRKSLSLTHTAVALGCIPAVVVIILFPNLLAERHDTLMASTPLGGGGAGGAKVSTTAIAGVVVALAAWVAVTEELIFRGLLVSAVRRWHFFRSPLVRDTAAVAISALLFGVAHWATWGTGAAIALTGLGIGFGVAFVANGEQLLPLILYHFVFDCLSIAVSIYS